MLAKWLASPENPYFATNLANIVWAHFFGRGIIHAVDDVRVSNPASNPELLAELWASSFTEYHYDFKKLVQRHLHLADLPAVDAGQRQQRRRHAAISPTPIRRMRAEILLDCISAGDRDQEQVPRPAAGRPGGADRRRQRIDTYFLTTFGRATRETVCSCEVKLEPTLSQSLHLLNGGATTAKIQQGGVIGRMLKAR